MLAVTIIRNGHHYFYAPMVGVTRTDPTPYRYGRRTVQVYEGANPVQLDYSEVDPEILEALRVAYEANASYEARIGRFYC